MTKRIFHSTLYMTTFLVFLSVLTACSGRPAEESPIPEQEEQKKINDKRKYPGANSRMVYIPQEDPVLQQWSLEGEKLNDIEMPVEKYGGTDDEYNLLWVAEDELIWSVCVEDRDGYGYKDIILSTPMRNELSKERVLTDETKELFVLGGKDSDDSIDLGGLGDPLEDGTGILYVDGQQILFLSGGELYEYDRVKKRGPARIKSPDCADSSWYAVSAEMMGTKMIFHTGATQGTTERNSYEFWSYDMDEKQRDSIDNRCYTGAAYTTDALRNKVYYQIIDDQGIWEYDGASGEKKELISEEKWRECYNENQLNWDYSYYNDLLFAEENRLYYIKNREDPLVFSYSFQDGSLSYEEKLTDAVRRSGYEDVYEKNLTVVRDKLILCFLNDELEACYLCIDLKTAELKLVGKKDPEVVYFGMLGQWYASEAGRWWKEGKKEIKDGKEKDTAPAGRAETAEEQLALLCQQKNVWVEEPNPMSELPPENYYAITDLDHDGRLEVIRSSGSQGSGAYTTSEYFQISMDGSRLRPIHSEGSDNDIVDGIRTAYVNPESDTYYYCVKDYISGGAGARAVWYSLMSLENGMVTNRIYADGFSSWNKKKDKEVWQYSYYRNGKKKELNEKEFDPESIADKLLHGYKKKKVNISWFFLDSSKMPSDKKLKRMAEKSYKEFRVG